VALLRAAYFLFFVLPAVLAAFDFAYAFKVESFFFFPSYAERARALGFSSSCFFYLDFPCYL